MNELGGSRHIGQRLSTGAATMKPFSTDTIEYPGELLLDGLLCDVLYCYVVNSYLDWLVNYTKHESAWMIVRYKADGHANEIAEIATGKRTVCRYDDVVLIRTSHDGLRRWLFYFDRDSSDCCIGWVLASHVSHDEMLAFARESDDLGEGSGDVKTLLPIAKLPEWVRW